MSLIEQLRAAAREAPESGIVEVFTHGRGRQGLIPLWAGESDRPTPAFIAEAAARSLAAGETFYMPNRGIPELRESLARYHRRYFGQAFAPEQFIVTGGGMQAIQLALQATAGAGDEVLYLSPAWPNLPAAAAIAGAVPVAVELGQSGNGWSLDVDRLAAAVTPRTRAIFVNSPSNPTGWTADRETLAAIVDLARRHGLWIIADEIYSLFHYDGGRAPSFMDVMEAEDRILFVNTFSKNWAMTGWRIGWLTLHPSLQQVFENLVQYATSGVAAFMQRGAVAALEEGDGFLADEVKRAHLARDRVAGRLVGTGKVRLSVPPGAFYMFFAIDGQPDSRQAAFALIDDVAVGLAPGSAFGVGADGYLRLCFHRELGMLEEAAERIASWIETKAASRPTSAPGAG
ncbi:MAG: pyridoxal phosphate-dependent aminotransferase [Mesorhizobium sp.]